MQVQPTADARTRLRRPGCVVIPPKMLATMGLGRMVPASRQIFTGIALQVMTLKVMAAKGRVSDILASEVSASKSPVSDLLACKVSASRKAPIPRS